MPKNQKQKRQKNGGRQPTMSIAEFVDNHILSRGGLWSSFMKTLKTQDISPSELKRYKNEVEPLLQLLSSTTRTKKVSPISKWDMGLLLGFTSCKLLPKKSADEELQDVYWYPSECIRTSDALGIFQIDVTQLPYSKRREVMHHFINVVYDPCNNVEAQFKLLQDFAQLAIMQRAERGTIKVGVLHSLTGTMAISERPLVDATMMAIDEINAAGGILGQKIEPIVVDGASDWDTFSEEASILVNQEGVSSVFGGWTSASRKAMKPIFEQYGNLLWYPLQYEGLEESANIMYTGAAPNQQVLPAVDWAFKKLGKTFFLVGSDYVFPRSANEIMKAHIQHLGGGVVGEEYEDLGGRDFAHIVEKISKRRPAVILNTINGDSNIAFFKQLRNAGIAPDDIPTVSFSVAEEEIINLGPKVVAGDFAAWNYFQSLTSEKNRIFVKNFQKKYGKHRVTDDPIEAAYFSVYLFASAVEKADSNDPIAIRDAAKGQVVYAPEGEVLIDPETQHSYRKARIGQIREDGQFDVVWSSDNPIKPEPYPEYKTKQEWNAFLDNLYLGWEKHWAKQ